MIPFFKHYTPLESTDLSPESRNLVIGFLRSFSDPDDELASLFQIDSLSSITSPAAFVEFIFHILSVDGPITVKHFAYFSLCFLSFEVPALVFSVDFSSLLFSYFDDPNKELQFSSGLIISNLIAFNPSHLTPELLLLLVPKIPLISSFPDFTVDELESPHRLASALTVEGNLLYLVCKYIPVAGFETALVDLCFQLISSSCSIGIIWGLDSLSVFEQKFHLPLTQNQLNLLLPLGIESLNILSHFFFALKNLSQAEVLNLMRNGLLTDLFEDLERCLPESSIIFDFFSDISFPLDEDLIHLIFGAFENGPFHAKRSAFLYLGNFSHSSLSRDSSSASFFYGYFFQ